MRTIANGRSIALQSNITYGDCAMAGKRKHTMLVLAAIAPLLSFAGLTSAIGQTSAGDDIVVADLDECSGNVPFCTTVRTPMITVMAGQTKLVKVMCPSDSFFWNWTAEASRMLVITKRSEKSPTFRLVPSNRPVLDAQKRPIGAVFTLDEQTSTRAGKGQISIGCSTEDPTGKLVAQRSSFAVSPRRTR